MRHTYATKLFAVSALVLIVSVFEGRAQDPILVKPVADDKEEPAKEIFWEIKAYKIFETLLDVKAIDKDGKMHDIRAIQNSEDVSILDVKAFVDGERLPVKLIIKNGERYYPLKAIDSEGNLIDIKAITPDGNILPVKGVSKTGNVVHLRAIAEDQSFYDIIAMSPDISFNHVKGIKMTDNPVEAIVNGVSIFAHVKSIK